MPTTRKPSPRKQTASTAVALSPTDVARRVTDKRAKTPAIDDLKVAGVSLLRRFIEVDGQRTEVLRDLSRIVVGLRLQVQYNGKPDLAGRSPEYKGIVAAIYEEAGVPADSQSGMQSTLRYHIGNTLRDTASPAALTAAGIQTASPRAQQGARQAQPGGRGTKKAADQAASARRSSDAEPGTVAAEAQALLHSGDPVNLVQQAVAMTQAAMVLPKPEDDTNLRLAVMTLLGVAQQFGEQLAAIETTARETAPAA